jgi:hypothetical protein
MGRRKMNRCQMLSADRHSVLYERRLGWDRRERRGGGGRTEVGYIFKRGGPGPYATVGDRE